MREGEGGGNTCVCVVCRLYQVRPVEANVPDVHCLMSSVFMFNVLPR